MTIVSIILISGCTNGTLQPTFENDENISIEEIPTNIQNDRPEKCIGDCITEPICGNGIIEQTEECDIQGCEENQTCNANCTCENNSDRIFIAIDSESYKNLEEEITRFTEDIKKDTKTFPILKIYDTKINKNVIKSDIKEINDNFDLKGLIFIGQIPFGVVKKSEYSTYPSDVYYFDLDNKCKYDQEGLIDHSSLWETCYFALSYFEIPFWVGRIKPPVSGNEGIELMRDYFNRNHAYRTGSAQYEKEMLVYLEIYEDPNSEGTTIEAVKNDFVDYAITWGGLYNNENEFDVIIPPIRQGYENCNLDKTFLDRLESKKYEYVFINAHGSPNYHRCDITPDKIKNNENKGLLYVMRSCSVGNYSVENYLGGWYLFAGEGLVVDAPSFSVFGASIIDFVRDTLLSQGFSIGEASRLNNNIGLFSLLGDPTIKLREATKSEANIQVSLDKIEFEDADISIINEDCKTKRINFEVTNNGKKDLIIDTLISHTLTSYKELSYNKYSPNIWIGFPELDTTWGEAVIKPGETVLAEAAFCPYGKGYYSGKLILFSNADNETILEIPFTGRGK